MKFKIQKGVDFPAKYGRKRVYPFENMKIGESFLVLKHTGDNTEMRTKQQLISNAARNFVRKSPRCGKWKFATRMTDEGLRVWRIK